MNTVREQVFSSIWPIINSQVNKYLMEQLFLQVPNHITSQNMYNQMNQVENQVRTLIITQLRAQMGIKYYRGSI